MTGAEEIVVRGRLVGEMDRSELIAFIGELDQHIARLANKADQPEITRGDQRRFSEYLASLAATEEAKIDRLREHGDGSMVASAQDLAFGCLVVSAHLAALADGENGA